MSNKVYRIGDAAKLLEVKTSVLRFWEEEFSQVRPKRTDKGQRYYSEKDMETLVRIRSLLYDEGMTISGAQKALCKPQDPADDNFIEPKEIASEEINSKTISIGTKNIQIDSDFTPLHTTMQTFEQISEQTPEQILGQNKKELELETQKSYKENISEIQEELKNILELLSHKP